MLKKIQQLLVTNSWLTEQELAKQMHTSAEALEPMLELLIRRGLVAKQNGQSCGGKCGCSQTSLISYHWLNQTKSQQPIPLLIS